jgi:hypothetical protein
LGDANRHKELLKKKRRLAEQTVSSLSIQGLDWTAHGWRSCTPTMIPLASDLLPFPGADAVGRPFGVASRQTGFSSSGRIVIDRLTRNVDLLRSLVASDVDLVFCDLPHVPPGAMGRFLLTQMASVAELEAGLISERTKAALAAAKASGVKLGNPNGARALKGKQVGNKQAVAAVRANAEHRAANLRAIVDDLRAQGLTSVRAIAAQLNERGILTARGGSWHPTSAARSRLQAAS